MNNTIKKEIKLEVNTSLAKARLAQVNSSINKLKNELKNIDVDEDTESFKLWAEYLNDAEKEAQQLKNQIKGVGEESKKTTNESKKMGDVSTWFEKARKSALRFTIGLFGIRSAWSIVTRASSANMSQNEDTANKVASIWTYLGNIFGPVIEKIVSWLQYGIAYINVFVKALTGVDFLAKSIQKTTKATNKELKKTVSSMDEIVNLDLDRGGADTGAGTANALQDIADLQLDPRIVKFLQDVAGGLKTVWDYAKTAWDFLSEHFGKVGAGVIVGGLALLIGSGLAANPVGLLGVASILALIDTITFVNIIKQTDDLKKSVDNMTQKGVENNDKYTESLENIGDKLGNLSSDQMLKYLQTQEPLIEGTEDMINSLDREYSWYEKLTGIYDDNMDLLKSYNNEQNAQSKAMQKVIDYYTKENEKLDKNSIKYQENNKIIEQAKKNLDKLKDYKAKATVQIDVDDKKYQTWFGNFLSGTTNFFTNLLHGKISTKALYADGGFPNKGQMFIANEAGPELVGNIGGSSAVVNNSQIVESVSKGVASAVASVLGTQRQASPQATYLYLNGREFAQAVYSDMETETSRRNKNTSIRRA